MLEKTLESPLDSKETQPLNPKGNQFIERTDAEAETLILWPFDMKSWLTVKDPDARRDWRQEEKGTPRGQDCWMASPTQCTRVWANSKRRWRTGKPGVLQSMALQRAGHDWMTEHQQNSGKIRTFHPPSHLIFHFVFPFILTFILICACFQCVYVYTHVCEQAHACYYLKRKIPDKLTLMWKELDGLKKSLTLPFCSVGFCSRLSHELFL